ncbi:MAG: 2-phosphosulfolactate phosphatase [Verrucomicrobiota bacterium]
MKSIDVLFTPADFSTLPGRDLAGTCCVVFDVLRATSSMITALAAGAEAILPVAEIPEALEIRARDPRVLLAGERDGVRIRAALTGSIDFDLGNSPREFTADRVAGRRIAMSTTNGTRALRSCRHADMVFAGSFLNLDATAAAVHRLNPERLLLICSGTYEETAYEDILGAGALCEQLWPHLQNASVSDAARVARWLYLAAREDLPAAVARSRNGARLLSVPELKDDVAFSLRVNANPLTATLRPDGSVGVAR